MCLLSCVSWSSRVIVFAPLVSLSVLLMSGPPVALLLLTHLNPLLFSLLQFVSHVSGFDVLGSRFLAVVRLWLDVCSLCSSRLCRSCVFVLLLCLVLLYPILPCVDKSDSLRSIDFMIFLLRSFSASSSFLMSLCAKAQVRVIRQKLCRVRHCCCLY